ncbi:hypothetical protein MRX96_014914 [Rhipicephalus microplus]
MSDRSQSGQEVDEDGAWENKISVDEARKGSKEARVVAVNDPNALNRRQLRHLGAQEPRHNDASHKKRADSAAEERQEAGT